MPRSRRAPSQERVRQTAPAPAARFEPTRRPEETSARVGSSGSDETPAGAGAACSACSCGRGSLGRSGSERTTCRSVRGCGAEEVDCAATLQIARDILGLAARSKWANGEPFNVGIALHFGSVTCGNVGLDAQRDATIIGDVVNTVFRLESVMKELNQAVLVSADFAERLPASEKLVDLGERKLKGKQQAVRIYGLG